MTASPGPGDTGPGRGPGDTGPGRGQSPARRPATATGRPKVRRRGAGFATVAAAGVIAAGLIVVLLVQLASSNKIKSHLGSPVFNAGRAKFLADQIAAPAKDGRGGPLLFQALVRQRDIYLQHEGADPAKGWLAFDAHTPGQPRSCVLEWLPASSRFRDPCTTTTYPSDGAGLPQYATSVNSAGNVVVDLNSAVPNP